MEHLRGGGGECALTEYTNQHNGFKTPIDTSSRHIADLSCCHSCANINLLITDVRTRFHCPLISGAHENFDANWLSNYMFSIHFIEPPRRRHRRRSTMLWVSGCGGGGFPSTPSSIELLAASHCLHHRKPRVCPFVNAIMTIITQIFNRRSIGQFEKPECLCWWHVTCGERASITLVTVSITRSQSHSPSIRVSETNRFINFKSVFTAFSSSICPINCWINNKWRLWNVAQTVFRSRLHFVL